MAQEITVNVIAYPTDEEAVTVEQAVEELNKRYDVTYYEATENENGATAFYFELENEFEYIRGHKSTDWLDPDEDAYLCDWAESDDIYGDVMDALDGWEDVHFTATGVDDNAYSKVLNELECGY